MPQLNISIPADTSLAQLPMSMLYLSRKYPQIDDDSLKIACLDVARRLPEHQRRDQTIVTPPDLQLHEIKRFVGLISTCYPCFTPERLEEIRKDLVLTLVSYKLRDKTRNEIVESLWPVVNSQAGQFDPEMLTALRKKLDANENSLSAEIDFPVDLPLANLNDFLFFYAKLFPNTPAAFLEAEANKFIDCAQKSEQLLNEIRANNYSCRDQVVTKIWLTGKLNPDYVTDKILQRVSRFLGSYAVNLGGVCFPGTLIPEDYSKFTEMFAKLFPNTPARFYDHLQKQLKGRLAVAQKSQMIDCDSDSEKLLLVFSGLNGRHVNGFEFMTYFGKYDTNKIFIKDPLAAWFQLGLPGISTNIETTMAHLRDLIAPYSDKRITSVGVSAGGYMAILAGVMLNLDSVVAFAPQTFLSNELRAAAGEDRWPEENTRINSSTEAQREYFDLLPIMQSADASPHIDIHYSAECILDEKHAHRLAGFDNVHIHCHNSNVHNTAWVLRERGELDRVLDMSNFREIAREVNYFSNDQNWQ